MKRYILKIIIIIFLVNLIPPTTSAQDLSEELHEKYWWYRHRFRQYFIDIGAGEGKSLVASRHKWRGQNISVGDQTIKLGWYLGILSLEYYQIEYEASGSGDMTLTELYYALQTYERLDKCED